MPRIRQIQAVPPSIHTKEEDIPRLGLNSRLAQHIREWYAGPFGNCRPTLLANVLCNLRSRRITLQLRERKLTWPGHEPFDGEPPLRESGSHIGLVRIVFRHCRVDGRKVLRDF